MMHLQGQMIVFKTKKENCARQLHPPLTTCRMDIIKKYNKCNTNDQAHNDPSTSKRLGSANIEHQYTFTKA